MSERRESRRDEANGRRAGARRCACRTGLSWSSIAWSCLAGALVACGADDDGATADVGTSDAVSVSDSGEGARSGDALAGRDAEPAPAPLANDGAEPAPSSTGDDEATPTPSPTGGATSGHAPIDDAPILDDLPGDAGVAVDAPPGRWRRARNRSAPDDDVDVAVEALRAIGYTAGSEMAGERSGVVRHDRARVASGLNLVVSGHGAEAILMDMDGRTVHRWSFSFDEAFPDSRVPPDHVQREFWRRAHLFENGDLLAIYEGLGLVKVDKDSRLLWSYDGRAHHDVDVHPEGLVFVITRTGRVVPWIHPELKVLDDFITVLDADGRHLGSVSMLDCIDNAGLGHVLEGWQPTEGNVGNCLHTNTLQYIDGSAAAGAAMAQGDAGDGDVETPFTEGRFLVSFRQQGLLALVDFGQQDIVWHLQGSWRMQHQPELLADGSMLLFDNVGMPRHSRVLELDPLSGEILWAYQEDEPDAFFTGTCGSSQRLENGNTLIVESNSGRAFEVTREGEIVWEYLSTFRAGENGELVATLFDVVRMPAGFPVDWL